MWREPLRFPSRGRPGVPARLLKSLFLPLKVWPRADRRCEGLFLGARSRPSDPSSVSVPPCARTVSSRRVWPWQRELSLQRRSLPRLLWLFLPSHPGGCRGPLGRVHTRAAGDSTRAASTVRVARGVCRLLGLLSGRQALLFLRHQLPFLRLSSRDRPLVSALQPVRSCPQWIRAVL